MTDPLSKQPAETFSAVTSDEAKEEGTSLAGGEMDIHSHGKLTNGLKNDSGHTLAPKLPNAQSAMEVTLSRPPSRPSSPAMIISSANSRRASQVTLLPGVP
jgi:hypothetical protein